MCGICGIVSTENPDRALVTRMRDALQHRGPDGAGLWCGEGVALGHVRLAILDPEGGAQPMASASGRFQITFNGEIYNFREVAAELEAKGLVRKTRSDTEVILAAYEAWGPECLSHFNGMFALAIWDNTKRELFLARDRLGKKPLHYALDPASHRQLAFASELKALLLVPWVSKALDPLAIAKYFAYDYIPAPRSIFRSIRKLRAGHYALFRSGSWQETCYWQPPVGADTAQPHRTDEEWLSAIEATLRKSVERRLVSDVPLGVFLSGGIDSSTVVALVRSLHPGQPLQTFSIGFEERSFDETSYARKVAKYFSTDHQEDTLSLSKALEIVPHLPDIMDEPMADPSVIPTYYLSRHARRSVKVALGGDGGDEVFVGYENYRAAYWAKAYRTLPRLLRKGVIEILTHKLPSSDRNLSLDYKVKRFLKGIDFPTAVANYIWLGSLTPSEEKEFFTNEFWLAGPKDSVEEIYSEVFDAHPPADYAQFLSRDLGLYLEQDILVKVDRAGMANALEIRAPFLDYELVELLQRIPVNQRFRGWQLKRLLKGLMKGKLPAEIIGRPKKGFGIPVTRWLRQDLAKLVESQLSPERLRQGALFKPEWVKARIREHASGKVDHRKFLWALLMFQLWRERYNV